MVVHARLVLRGPCPVTVAMQGAMYHIVKFYVATWETICMWASGTLEASSFSVPLQDPVIPPSSSLSVPPQNVPQEQDRSRKAGLSPKITNDDCSYMLMVSWLSHPPKSVSLTDTCRLLGSHYHLF